MTPTASADTGRPVDELAAAGVELLWSERLLRVVQYLYSAGRGELAYYVLELQAEHARTAIRVAELDPAHGLLPDPTEGLEECPVCWAREEECPYHLGRRHEAEYVRRCLSEYLA